MRLGSKIDPNLSGRAALARGATQFKVSQQRRRRRRPVDARLRRSRGGGFRLSRRSVGSAELYGVSHRCLNPILKAGVQNRVPKAVGEAGENEHVEDSVPIYTARLAPEIHRSVVDRGGRRGTRRKNPIMKIQGRELRQRLTGAGSGNPDQTASV